MHRVAIIGAGAVGSSLALRLTEVGWDVCCVVSRSAEHAADVGARLSNCVTGDSLDAVPRYADTTILCVPDDALTLVSERLARTRDAWKHQFIAHVSGRHTVDVLQPFSDAGATVAGFHPLQTFPARFDPSVFRNCVVGLEGSPAAISFGQELAAALGATTVQVATADKPLYHLAASVASNFLVALLHVVERAVQRSEDGSTWSVQSFEPLVYRTLRNVINEGAEQALTGPVVRGDRSTVEAHLTTLQTRMPEWEPLYRALARVTLDAARSSGRLPSGAADEMSRVLDRPQSPSRVAHYRAGSQRP